MEFPTHKDVVVRISAASVVKAALALSLLYALFLLRDLVLVLIAAVVIASAIEPATKWCGARGLPRLPSVILMYLCVAVVLFGTFYVLVPPLLSDTSDFLSRVPQLIESRDLFSPPPPEGLQEEAAAQLPSGGIVGTLDSVGVSIGDVVSGLSGYLRNIPGGVFNTVSAVFGGALSFVLIVVISFYLAVQKDGIGNFLRIVTPYQHQEYVVDLWRRAQKKIGLWMQGQLLLVLLIGVLVYLSLTILGVEHALLFAILAAVFELIPLFGPVLASIPAIAAGFIDGGVTLALIIAGVYVIIQQFENHLIYPLVVHKVVGVPALLVIIALVVGGRLAGFLGIILAVPIATALMEFVSDIERKNQMLAEHAAAKQ